MPNPHHYASHIATLIGAPGENPVTLAEAKSHLRVDHSEEDATIHLYINAAVSYLDGMTGILGRAIVDQSWRLTVDYDDAPDDAEEKLYLPVLSARELLAVKYYNASNVLITASLSDWVLVTNSWWAYVIPANNANWPELYDRPDALQIEWRAGYGDAADVPSAIKAAILLMTEDLYRNRGTVAIGVQSSAIPMSPTVSALLAPYRLVGM